MKKSEINTNTVNRILDKIVEEYRQQGIELGIEKSNLEVAVKMIKKGIPLDNIRDITGISFEVNNPGNAESGTIAEKYLKQGMKKGIEIGKFKIAVKMIGKGMADDVISDISGLNIKKIQKLRASFI